MTVRPLHSSMFSAGLCWTLALVLGGCAVLGGASKGTEAGLGGVDKAFHDAFYKAQLAKLKGDQAGAKDALLSCLDADPNEAVVYYELARLERQAEQWPAAHAAILEWIRLQHAEHHSEAANAQQLPLAGGGILYFLKELGKQRAAEAVSHPVALGLFPGGVKDHGLFFRCQWR